MLEFIVSPGPFDMPHIGMSVPSAAYVLAPITFVTIVVTGLVMAARAHDFNLRDELLSIVPPAMIAALTVILIFILGTMYAGSDQAEDAYEAWTEDVGQWLSSEYYVDFTASEMEKLTTGEDVDGRRDGEPVIYRLIQEEKSITFVTVDHTVVPVK